MTNRRDFFKTSTAFGLGAALTSACSVAENATAMSVFDAIQKRRSVRKFKDTPVPEEHLTKIIDAARMAPTSGNQQPWKFLIIRDRRKLNQLKEACIQRSIDRFKENKNPSEEELAKRKESTSEYYNNILSAPVYVVVLVDMKSKWPTYNRHDGPMGALSLMLAARALGYGTVYFTDSIPDDVTREVLEIPEQYERMCITPIGVPDKWPETPEKKPLEDFIVYEKF